MANMDLSLMEFYATIIEERLKPNFPGRNVRVLLDRFEGGPFGPHSVKVRARVDNANAEVIIDDIYHSPNILQICTELVMKIGEVLE